MGAPRRSATQVLAWACLAAAVLPAVLAGAPQTAAPATSANRMVTEADCAAPSLVATIAPAEVGEPVRSITLQAAWVAATDAVPAHCRVDGVFAPVDTAPTARVINFRVILPASWTRRAAQIGGGGINGIIPNLAGGEFGAGGPTLLQRGFATYGSDSGHQLPAFGRRGGAPPAPPDQDWALNEEAIRNFGYAQMKKTHDAAMVLIQRIYGDRPRFNYYIGTSQGGREALTVAAALSRRLRRHRGQCADRELLVADARARAHPHPREAAGQLGDAGQGQRDPRRVRAPVRQARRPGRRHHEQLHGLPRDLRPEPRRAQPPPVGREALPEQRRPRSVRHERERLPHRRPDLDARVRLLALQVRVAARQRRPRVRDVAAQHRSVGQRSDPAGPIPGTGRRAGGGAHALASRRPRRHRLPDAGRQSQPARLRRRRPAQRATALPVGDSRFDQSRSSARSRAAAAR